MSKEKKENIEKMVNILKQLDEKSLRALECGASILLFRDSLEKEENSKMLVER